jgi:predicted dehydrogenase
MGPYYITSLVTLLGPVARVIGAASRTRDARTIGSGPRQGETVPVTTPTHVTGVLMHASGALSTLLMSFDSVSTRALPIEVHGELASLLVPDPNRFDGAVFLRAVDDADWRSMPTSAGYQDAARGYGLADLAATPADAEPRCGGTLAFHVLDIMESLLASADTGRAVAVNSTCDRPRPVQLGPAPTLSPR